MFFPIACGVLLLQLCHLASGPCPERSHVVEFAAADAQEDGVLNATPGGVPAHGEGGDDAVLRR